MRYLLDMYYVQNVKRSVEHAILVQKTLSLHAEQKQKKIRKLKDMAHHWNNQISYIAKCNQEAIELLNIKALCSSTIKQHILPNI